MAKTSRTPRAGGKRKSKSPRTKPGPPPLMLKVKGTWRPGRVPVPELLALCQHAQSAVNRQAEAIKGKNTLRPGPTIEQVRLECTLELASLRSGSSTLGFELSAEQASLPIMAALGERAIVGVAEAIEELSEGRTERVDPGVLDSLNSFGAVIQSPRVQYVQWIAQRSNGHRKQSVVGTFDERVKNVVAQRLRPPIVSRITIEGLIEMADFKPGDLKCRVLQPLGETVPCTFGADDADQVYSVLRKTARVEGDAAIDPQTGKIDTFQIVTVTPVHSLTIGKGHFFHGPTLEELARAQDIEPLEDVSALAGGLPDDQDVDLLLADIYRQRE